MTLPRLAARAAFATFASILAAATLAPHAVRADINVSPNTGSLSADDTPELTSTLKKVSTSKTTKAKTNNINVLQDDIESLNAQINTDQRALSNMSSSNASYPALQAKIEQQKATASALQGILDHLKQGNAITDYATSTDAATQETTVTINFSGNSNPLTASIPAVTDSNGYATSNATSTSSGADGSDMLTQLLQQAATQLAGGSNAAQNPLGMIQNTLNNIVASNAAPLTDTTMTCPDNAGGETNPSGVATYDISAGKVYMPDGSVLEAHSGLGTMMDNPAYANQPNNGPTPPNTYSLSIRESLFHGVEAIRLNPVGNGNMYNRDGILAHTPMLKRTGTNGSNGCVAFPDYASFLSAFKSGQVKTLVVVPSKAGAKASCRPVAYDTPTPQSYLETHQGPANKSK